MNKHQYQNHETVKTSRGYPLNGSLRWHLIGSFNSKSNNELNLQKS
jgi:hypothetical protein